MATTTSNTAALKTILITGGNRGIGFSIAEGLAKDIQDYQIIITSRDKAKAEAAIKTLEAKYPSAAGRLFAFGTEITDYSTVTALKEWISQKFGSLDVLINNAAIASQEAFDATKTEETLKVNFFSTVNITEQLLPLINQHGKIIFISSTMGTWQKFARTNKDTVKRLLSEKNSVEDLKSLAQEFLTDVRNGAVEGKWFYHTNAYCLSKLLVNVYTRVLAETQLAKEKGLQVYTVCPGWCQTDMGGANALKTAEEGADTPVYLVNLPFRVDEKLQGQFIRDREQTQWEYDPSGLELKIFGELYPKEVEN